MQINKLKLLVSVILALALVGFVYFIYFKNPGLPGLKIKNQAQGTLVSGFPDVPVYEGAKLKNSFSGTQNGKTVYGATWTVDRINDKPVDETGVRLVMHWYEDDAFPESWVFVEPLQQEGNVDNPSKDTLKVSKNGVLVALVVERKNPKEPVIITVLATIE